jgi:hypothetical protein
MSKIFFTIFLPHDSPSGFNMGTPRFLLSCTTNASLGMKGGELSDIWGTGRGNSNVNQSYKNRFEYSVTAVNGVTKLSLYVCTDIHL